MLYLTEGDLQTMNYKKEILNALIQSYENSKWFRDGTITRRILIPKSKKNIIEASISDYEHKQEYLHVLFSLKEQGIIDFSWIRYEEGNLIDAIWLQQDKNAVLHAYKLLHRKHKRTILFDFTYQIKEALDQIDRQSDIGKYLCYLENEMNKKLKILAPFSSDENLNKNLMKCLIFLSNNQKEVLTRMMSQELFCDSKYFEHELRSKVLSILRKVKKMDHDEFQYSDKELLQQYGISDYPEIIEFTGNLRIQLDDGNVIDYSKERFGTYINSETIQHITEITLHEVQRVLFIENKTNYVMQVKKNDPSALIIFHGGCYSPIKGMFFQKIYDSISDKSLISWEHWSDIDVGGFRIFIRLKENIIPTLIPYQMDVTTLEQYQQHAMKIENFKYLQTLQDMYIDERYEIFHSVINKMLDKKIRLEQEMECFE